MVLIYSAWHFRPSERLKGVYDYFCASTVIKQIVIDLKLSNDYTQKAFCRLARERNVKQSNQCLCYETLSRARDRVAGDPAGGRACFALYCLTGKQRTLQAN